MKVKKVKLKGIGTPKNSNSVSGRQYVDVIFEDEYGNTSVVYVTEGMRNYDAWCNWIKENYNNHTTEWDIKQTMQDGKGAVNKRKQKICDGDYTPTITATTSDALFDWGY